MHERVAEQRHRQQDEGRGAMPGHPRARCLAMVWQGMIHVVATPVALVSEHAY